MIVITAADHYIAQNIARHLLQEEELRDHAQIRLLARNPSRCEDLRRLGAQVVQVDYQQEAKLQEAIQDAQWVVLVPEPENTRVQGAERIIRVANNSRVKNVVVISSRAADAEGRTIQEYKQIERHVQRELQNPNWIVLRNDFLQQHFLYLSNWVEEKRQLPLPIQETRKFVPVDVNDISHAVLELITRGQGSIQNIEEGLNRQTLNLTGPEAVDGPHVVNEIKNATGNQVLKFQQIDREQFRRYLNQLSQDNAYKQMSSRAEQRLKSQGIPDQKPPTAPNRVEVEDIVELLDWINKGLGENVSQDLAKIIGENGHPVQEFFRRHHDSFKPIA